MNEIEEGCRGHREMGGGAVKKYKNNLLLHVGQKLRDDLFKTGCYPFFPLPLLLSAPPASRKGVRNWRLLRRSGLYLALVTKDTVV